MAMACKPPLVRLCICSASPNPRRPFRFSRAAVDFAFPLFCFCLGHPVTWGAAPLVVPRTTWPAHFCFTIGAPNDLVGALLAPCPCVGPSNCLTARVQRLVAFGA